MRFTCQPLLVSSSIFANQYMILYLTWTLCRFLEFFAHLSSSGAWACTLVIPWLAHPLTAISLCPWVYPMTSVSPARDLEQQYESPHLIISHLWGNHSEKAMAPHSSTVAWRIPETGEPGGLPSTASHRVGHDWSDLAVAAAEGSLYFIVWYWIPWQPWIFQDRGWSANSVPVTLLWKDGSCCTP